jgi:hypothetical protein
MTPGFSAFIRATIGRKPSFSMVGEKLVRGTSTPGGGISFIGLGATVSEGGGTGASTRVIGVVAAGGAAPRPGWPGVEGVGDVGGGADPQCTSAVDSAAVQATTRAHSIRFRGIRRTSFDTSSSGARRKATRLRSLGVPMAYFASRYLSD